MPTTSESSPTDPLAVLATCPDVNLAEAIAASLVEEGVAAAVNIVPAIRSVYRWRGEIVRREEALLVAKTVRRRAEKVVAMIAAAHPYEVPGIVTLSIDGGWPAYLAWLDEPPAART